MAYPQEIVTEWREKGYIKFVRWNTANDGSVCEVCRKRNYKQFLLSEIDQLLPAHEGCRCWLTPIIDIESIDFEFDDLRAALRSGKDID